MADVPDPDDDFDLGDDSGSGPDIDVDARRYLRLAGIAIVGLFVVVVLLGGYHQVPEGHVGVQKSFGAVTGAELAPGAHIIVPIKDSVQDVEIRPRTYTMANQRGEGAEPQRADAVTVQTVNGTTADIDITVRYRVQRDNPSRFVSEWSTVGQVEQRLIRPSVRSRLRDEAAGIQTSEIYTRDGRERLGMAAQEKLESVFDDEALVLEEVQVRDVDLPDSYDQALNEKEIAKQEVQQKEFEIQQAERERERREIQAEAEARVIEIRGQALRDNPIVLRQDYIRGISAADKVILATDDEGTPIILQTDAQGGGGGQTDGTTGTTGTTGTDLNITTGDNINATGGG